MFAILHNILISPCYLRLTNMTSKFFYIIKLCFTFHYLIDNSEYLDCTKISLNTVSGVMMASNITSFYKAQDIVWCKYCQKIPAAFYCQNCRDDMCQICIKNHKTDPRFAKHLLVLFSDKKTTRVRCKDHLENFYNEGCKTCGVPICPECKLKSHYSHTSIDIKNLCDLTQRKMKTSLTQMEDRRENIDFNMQQIIKADRFQEEVRENLRKGSMAMKSCIDNKLTGKIEKSYETVEQCLLRKKLEKEQREQNGFISEYI